MKLKPNVVLIVLAIAATAMCCAAGSALLGDRARAKSAQDAARVARVVMQPDADGTRLVTAVAVGKHPDELRVTITALRPYTFAVVREQVSQGLLALWNREHCPDTKCGSIVAVSEAGVLVFHSERTADGTRIVFD